MPIITDPSPRYFIALLFIGIGIAVYVPLVYYRHRPQWMGESYLSPQSNIMVMVVKWMHFINIQYLWNVLKSLLNIFLNISSLSSTSNIIIHYPYGYKKHGKKLQNVSRITRFEPCAGYKLSLLKLFMAFLNHTIIFLSPYLTLHNLPFSPVSFK